MSSLLSKTGLVRHFALTYPKFLLLQISKSSQPILLEFGIAIAFSTIKNYVRDVFS